MDVVNEYNFDQIKIAVNNTYATYPKIQLKQPN